jgi:hypothetical protein
LPPKTHSRRDVASNVSTTERTIDRITRGQNECAGMFSPSEGHVNIWRSYLRPQKVNSKFRGVLACSDQFGNTVQALAFILAELERGCCDILLEMLQ